MSIITDLGDKISMVDLHDLFVPERTGSYILHEDQPSIIETSASPSVPYLLNGLEQLEIQPEEIQYIIVTHIHLDHAGGVGVLLEHCPNATVVVHPRGARHIANPTKLIQGARAVYGDQFDRLFDPIKPVPEDRIITMKDSEQLRLSEDRVLTFYDTPGHAKHHFSIHDSVSNGMFTGDTIGVRYAQIADEHEFILPSTSPNQFNPDAMIQSMQRIKDLGVSRIFFGHYGVSEDPENVYRQINYFLPIFMDRGRKVEQEYEEQSSSEKAERLYELLIESAASHLVDRKVSDDHPVYQLLEVDLKVCAQGIIDYLEKNKSKQ
ncbi:MBL fold metallo-hydrolase [Allobacillus sp. GCM10007491]|uniref:MBL fold metallo-hydrolase n=1 Tax=Allobacillus saliphilus TaxID=2912308 RepID=A0A941CTR4_9BACI|nr:MBL fold metallo-hydrolase [Allobacillus saliphilus]MBR7553677.1 MBL fold metallo-hydrolase [Allobacillus saliphilus]